MGRFEPGRMTDSECPHCGCPESMLESTRDVSLTLKRKDQPHQPVTIRIDRRTCAVCRETYTHREQFDRPVHATGPLGTAPVDDWQDQWG